MTIEENQPTQTGGFYIAPCGAEDISKSVEMEWAKEMRNGERG